MAEERIQKVMSEQGLCSRRAAEQIIAEGRVKLNGHPVKVGDKMDPARDILTVDGERIYIQKDQQMYYLVLYKPRGYVTTASDELGRRTVMDLVKDVPARLYPVGRLDKDSEGLLLMTNDGEFANAMMHPSGGISKLYRVTVSPRAEEAQIIRMSEGVVLDDGTKTLPCSINVVVDEPGRTVMEMTLREGKNREIRRMCEAVGLQVVRLKRNAEGVVKLGMLQPGKYRELTKQELTGLRAAAAKGRAQTRSAALASKNASRRPSGPVDSSKTRKPARASKPNNGKPVNKGRK
jgi:23S rRNA pseudouridine2605 synthase